MRDIDCPEAVARIYSEMAHPLTTGGVIRALVHAYRAGFAAASNESERAPVPQAIEEMSHEP